MGGLCIWKSTNGGLLFKYFHFWGDYWHQNRSHSAYGQEIRIIRNHPDIHSYGDAQGFRRIPNFDGKNFRLKEGVYKLNSRLSTPPFSLFPRETGL